MPSFFSDLFSGTTTPRSRRENDSTYNSQVPRAADKPAPPPKPKPQAPVQDSPGTGSTGPNDPNGGSTYRSQVPWQASLPANTISLGPTGQTNSGSIPPPPGSGGSAEGPVSGSGGASPLPPGPDVPGKITLDPQPPPAPVAPMPYMPQWEMLAVPDAASNGQYVAQMAALQKALDNYTIQDTDARTQKMKATNASLTDLGWDDPDQYSGEGEGSWDERGEGSFGRSFVANEGDFAGRGGGRSGLYLQAVNRLNNDYNKRREAVGEEQQDWTQAQDTALQNQKDLTSASQATVKANTVAQLAAELGVDADMILSGFGSGTGKHYKRRIDEKATDKEREYVETSAKSSKDLNKREKMTAEAKRRAAQKILDDKYKKDNS